MELKEIKGIGIKTLEILNENEIYSVLDLLNKYPVKYENYQLINEIKKEFNDKVITIKTKIVSSVNIYNNSKIPYVIFNVLFNNNLIKVVGFRKNYLKFSLKEEQEIIINGKLNYYKNEIILNKVIKESNYRKIIPNYNIKGLFDKNINKIILNILENISIKTEVLPGNIIRKYNLISNLDKYNYLHNPKSSEDLKLGIKRVKYEEAYHFQKEMLSRVSVNKTKKPLKFNLINLNNKISELPFQLTLDQREVIDAIVKDLRANETKSRLIQGDVSSGKTVVAALISYLLAKEDLQIAFMAPTEILAKQHFDYFNKLMGNEIKIEFLTSNIKNRDIIISDLIQGNIKILIGTHALASEDIKFNNLKLVIIDEQHKFGVNIRNDLIKKSNTDVIYLTATPIPRTLAISMFEENMISTIKTMPSNRKKVITEVIEINEIDKVIVHIKKTILINEKVFVVTPAIKSLHAKYNVLNVYKAISRRLPEYKNIYMLHGQMKKEEIEQVIKEFSENDSGILIATSMIEVGIDIKDATLMVIFAANFFGLSQLHQLRGRVGRNNIQSYCYLVSEDKNDLRLNIIKDINDGFKLSEEDLKLRGPGMILGLDQTGDLRFKYLDFFKDYEILEKIRRDIELS